MHRRAFDIRLLAALALMSICATTGCTTAPARRDSAPSLTPSASFTPAPPPDPIAGMTLAQQVGQLFMVGTTASAAEGATLSAITERHVGNIFLSGRSSGGVAATAAVVAQFTALINEKSTAGQPLFVATDQEGGTVQVLQGSGFTRMPSGLTQGGMAPHDLASSAQIWGAQLRASGVTMDLGPVVDIVPSLKAARSNPPVGQLQREFGFDADTIVAHADAFRSGMSASGVVTVLKHFPGLGFVAENTDTHSGVTDSVVGSDGADAGIYRAEIAAGAQCIMVSSAIYQRIDANSPALFSSTVVTGMLRNKLGFTGVVMTDDVSGAKQIVAWSPADRAVLAISAGVDIVLVSRTPTVAAEMVDAVLAKAQADPQFAALVAAAARRVVTLKEAVMTRADDRRDGQRAG